MNITKRILQVLTILVIVSVGWAGIASGYEWTEYGSSWSLSIASGAQVDKSSFGGKGNVTEAESIVDRASFGGKANVTTNTVDSASFGGKAEASEVISITVEPANYGFGDIAEGANESTGSSGYFWANNTGNCNIDLSIKATNTTNWNIKASPGDEEFQLQQSNDSGVTWYTLTYTYTDLYLNLAQDGTIQFDLWMFMVTDTAHGEIEQTTTVTVKGVAT